MKIKVTIKDVIFEIEGSNSDISTLMEDIDESTRARDDFIECISCAVESERCRIGAVFCGYMREKALGRADVARALGCMPWELTAFHDGAPQNFGAIMAKIFEIFPEFIEHSNPSETPNS